MSDNVQENKKGSGRAVLIGILVALLGVSGIEGFMIFNKNKTVTAQKDTISTISKENLALISKIDSVQKSLQEQIEQGNLQQSQIDSLNKMNAELEESKKALRSQLAGVPAMKSRYEAKLAEAKLLIEELQGKVDNSDSLKNAMYADIMSLKNEKAKLLDSLNRIISEKEELKKTVKVAQVLKADNFHVSVLKKSGKEKDDDAMAYKAKNIDKVKVTFQVMENKVAVAETKSFYLKVIGPDGAVIYNESTGGGELDEDGSKTNYTSKQDLLYDGKKQNVTFLYHNQGTWQKGLHRVEVVCENKNIGSGTFVVK
ncbi:MAG: hypothetical protein U0V72_03155 [Cytophagales bacterium]